MVRRRGWVGVVSVSSVYASSESRGGGVLAFCICCLWALGGNPERGANVTLGDPCLFYGPFPANAHPLG